MTYIGQSEMSGLKQGDPWLDRSREVESLKDRSWVKLGSLFKGWWMSLYIIREYANQMQLFHRVSEWFKNIWEYLTRRKHLEQNPLGTSDVRGSEEAFINKRNPSNYGCKGERRQLFRRTAAKWTQQGQQTRSLPLSVVQLISLVLWKLIRNILIHSPKAAFNAHSWWTVERAVQAGVQKATDLKSECVGLSGLPPPWDSVFSSAKQQGEGLSLKAVMRKCGQMNENAWDSAV